MGERKKAEQICRRHNETTEHMLKTLVKSGFQREEEKQTTETTLEGMSETSMIEEKQQPIHMKLNEF